MKKVLSNENGSLAGRGHAKRARLALMVALAAIAVSCTGVASAAPASEGGGSYRPSAWAKSADLGPSGEAPSLTNDVGAPADASASLLPIGLCLLGLGALGLVFGLTAMSRKPRGRKAEPRVPSGTWRGTGRLPTGTGARP